MKYYLFTSKSKVSDIREFPAIVLRRDSWDDFGYKTTLDLTFYPSDKENGRNLGHIKIIHSNDNTGYTHFEQEVFDGLNDEYCSLGQSLEYYQSLKELNLEFVLKDLKDCATSDTVLDSFSNLDGFRSSLLRSSRSEKILHEAKIIFSSQVTVPNNIDENNSFTYKIKLPNSSGITTILFDFVRQEILPYRINVLVGKNACGKSQLLSNLALTMSGMGIENKGEIVKPNNGYLFGDIHVISYSPFDTFKELSQLNGGKVSKNNITSGFLPYNFYGIRKIIDINGKQEVILKSHTEIKKELNKSYKNILLRNNRHCLEELFEMCLGRSLAITDPKKIIENYDYFSSGQKIIIKMITDYLSSVNKDDLVLIDEPESYLHPQGISNFYHCIRKLTSYTKSYCIIATHSPIIIQETPSKYINILTEVGSQIKVKKPQSETLGQGISTIINEVFKLDYNDLNFFNTLQAFKNKGASLEELEQTLGNKLDFSAKTYFISIKEQNDEK